MFNLATDDLAVKPSHTKVYFNEFVANALRVNIGSKKNQPTSSEKTTTFIYGQGKPYNQTQSTQSNTIAQRK